MNNFFSTLKFRLTLWYAFLLTIFLSLFSLLMHSELSRVLYRDVDARLTAQAVSIDQSIQQLLHENAFKIKDKSTSVMIGHKTLAGTEARTEAMNLITRWEAKEKRLARATMMLRINNFKEPEQLANLKGWEEEIIFPDYERDSKFMESGSSFQTIHFKRKPIRLFYYVIRYDSTPLFVLQCGFPLVEVEGALGRLFLIIMIWVPIAVVIAGVFGWFLARRSLSPVEAMIQQARHMTANNLKGRLARSSKAHELDRLAVTINEMMDRIESSTNAVREFSIDVSHELKTPLAIIRGEIELALRKNRTKQELEETLCIIESEVAGLVRLVDDLMLLVRSDSNQLRFEKREIHLKDVAKYVVERFADRAKEQKIDLTMAVEQDAVVLGDESYLKRLLLNLVDNAIKFTPENGNVDIRVSRKGNSAYLHVKDTGMGIDAEVQEKVFARFFRTDQARTQEGSGLGLNIAKAICFAHQGELLIDSSPGRGTIVTVRIPSI